MTTQPIESPGNKPDILAALPVEILPEQAQDVGDYFLGILDQYGEPATLYTRGRWGQAHAREGERARIVIRDTAFSVERMNDTDLFPKIHAYFAQKDGKDMFDKPKWEVGDRFTFDTHTGKLNYRTGNTLLYAINSPVKPGKEGVQAAGKFGGIKVNTTPPTAEGVVRTLENFLQNSTEMMEKHDRLTQRVRRLGRKAGSVIGKMLNGGDPN